MEEKIILRKKFLQYKSVATVSFIVFIAVFLTDSFANSETYLVEPSLTRISPVDTSLIREKCVKQGFPKEFIDYFVFTANEDIYFVRKSRRYSEYSQEEKSKEVRLRSLVIKKLNQILKSIGINYSVDILSGEPFSYGGYKDKLQEYDYYLYRDGRDSTINEGIFRSLSFKNTKQSQGYIRLCIPKHVMIPMRTESLEKLYMAIEYRPPTITDKMTQRFYYIYIDQKWILYFYEVNYYNDRHRLTNYIEKYYHKNGKIKMIVKYSYSEGIKTIQEYDLGGKLLYEDKHIE